MVCDETNQLYRLIRSEEKRMTDVLLSTRGIPLVGQGLSNSEKPASEQTEQTEAELFGVFSDRGEGG